MDSDDISLPLRLEKQFSYMESHPNTVMCGTAIERFGDKTGAIRTPLKDLEKYRCTLLFLNPGPSHPTAFFRKAKLDQYHIQYAEWLPYAQDYELWTRIIRVGEIAELEEVLLYYRVFPQQISAVRGRPQASCAQLVQKQLLTELMGTVSEKEVIYHYKHSTGYYSNTVINPNIVKWYQRLLNENKHKKIYHQKKLLYMMSPLITLPSFLLTVL